jgi:hypothetical protein
MGCLKRELVIFNRAGVYLGGRVAEYVLWWVRFISIANIGLHNDSEGITHL